MKRMLMVVLTGLAVASGAWAKDVAYLGVATEPLDPMTGRHLGLGEGVGLAVVFLDEKGVLGDRVEEGDILHKFNDQLLVSPEQLAILVRREKPGGKAELTVLRGGKAETIEVKLGSIDSAQLPSLQPQLGWGRQMMGPHVFPMPGPQGGGPGTPDMREWMEDFQQKMRQWHGNRFGPPAQDDEDDAAAPEAKPGRPKVEVHSSATSVVSETKDGVTVTLTNRDGTRTAKIEKDDKIVFDGPVNNDKEMKKVPEEFRDRIGGMQDRVKVDIQTQEDSAPAPRRAGRKNVL